MIELIDEVAKESRCSPNHPCISAVTIGSTMDMSILRELFSNVARAAQILDISDDPVPVQALESMKNSRPTAQAGSGSCRNGTRITRSVLPECPIPLICIPFIRAG